MRKLLLIASTIVFALTITSCNSDEVFDVETPIPSQAYAKTIEIYNGDRDKSMEIKISSDNEDLLNNYINSTSFSLVKEDELQAKVNEGSIIGEDVNEEEENQTSGSIIISFNSDSPEGYYVHTELKNKLTRASFIRNNVLRMDYYNNARYAKSIFFTGATVCYASKRCAAKGRVYHPENGRRGYKSINYSPTIGDVISITP